MAVRRMMLPLLAMILFVNLSASAAVAPMTTGNKVLLISLDGFRWDYITKTTTPNFDRLVSEGSQVKQVTNAFATLTMPNHYTIVTGLYEENHGIIANGFYDPNYDKTYSYSTETIWYNSTEPIWVTAEREGKKAGAYMWVGNEAEYEGVTVTKARPFLRGVEPELAMEVVIDWLVTDDLDFACLYIDEPDGTGHSFGPESDELKVMIRQLDALIGRLIRKLEDHDLSDKVNILIGSDHGMTEVSNERSINLGTYVDFKNDVEWSYASAIGLIVPKPGKHDKVYRDLLTAQRNESHFAVYNKSDIPEELHYKNNDRIPPIVLKADPGYLLKKTNKAVTMKANHGFDNQHPDMKTTLIARGPDFKCNYKQDELRSVDLYPLMCHIFGLKTCHTSSGDLERARGMVNYKATNCLSTTNKASKLVNPDISFFLSCVLHSIAAISYAFKV